MSRIFSACLALFALLGTSASLAKELPIEDFFKDAEFSNVTLSPTGEYITVSVPQGDRTLLAAFRVADMSLVAKWDYGTNQHIDRVSWVNDERFFMFVTRKTGRFDFRVVTPDVYASDVSGKRRTDIPNGGYYQVVDTLDDDPRNILVQRSIDSAFLFKMDVYTGKTVTVATAPLRFGNFLVDHDRKVRFAVGLEDNNESVTLRRDGEKWVEVHRAEMGAPTRRPLMFAPDNRQVYFVISQKGEPSSLYLIDPESREQSLIVNNANVEADEYLVSSDQKTLLAASFMDGLPSYQFINSDHEESKAYAGLINAFPNHAVSFRGISDDGRYILFLAYSDVDPGSYYLFDRQTVQAKFLLSGRSWIKPEEMSPMRAISVTARDGKILHGYLTIPQGSDGKNLPLILHPHGGPHGPRDEWRFNPEVQFLANRGYAVLQINFRGSGGYGSAFESAGYRAWGTTMIDDMTDAVQWTVEQGIADADRVCVYGASYGGYAALQSVVREPDRYRCSIGYVGLYSMDLWMKDSDVADTESGREYQKRVFPEDSGARAAQSPAFNVERIKVPVMLVHGAKDARVPISQYRLLKKNLEAAGKSPEVDIVEAKEGHGFYDLDNNVRLYTAMQAFLDKHIGRPRNAAAE